MDIGFAQAGFDIAFANDIDPFAIATHKKTHLSKDPKWAEAASQWWEMYAISIIFSTKA